MKNKIALITGASSGIGKELAIQLHGKGFKVLLVARREEKLIEICSKLNQIRSSSAEYLAKDITNSEQLAEIIDYLNKEDIDLLINNAGRGSFGYFDQQDISVEIKIVQLNINAPLILSHAVIRNMKRKKDGAIINLSSIAGYQPIPLMSTYAGTKAFNLFHSLALAFELEKFNINVLTVCPGPVETEFFGVARVDGTWTGGSRDNAGKVANEIINALEKKQKLVLPGMRGKIYGTLASLCPKIISTRIVGRMLAKTYSAI